MLVLVYLFIPIAVVGVLSFNKPASDYNTQWNQFSIDAWTNLCGVPAVCHSFVVSIRIALISTLGGHDLGHDDRFRPGALSLPRSAKHQPVDLPADGHP